MIEEKPQLVFSLDFDERVAFEAAGRGYLSCVHVALPDGTRCPVVFYDPIRLQQDLEDEGPAGVPLLQNQT